jgi:hypothetical protein
MTTTRMLSLEHSQSYIRYIFIYVTSQHHVSSNSYEIPTHLHVVKTNSQVVGCTLQSHMGLHMSVYLSICLSVCLSLLERSKAYAGGPFAKALDHPSSPWPVENRQTHNVSLVLPAVCLFVCFKQYLLDRTIQSS